MCLTPFRDLRGKDMLKQAASVWERCRHFGSPNDGKPSPGTTFAGRGGFGARCPRSGICRGLPQSRARMLLHCWDFFVESP
jgi:hypothetical protein